VRAADIGDNDRLGVNRAPGAMAPALTSGQPAYRFVPDWKEQGRRTNYDRLALPPEHRDRCLVVPGPT